MIGSRNGERAMLQILLIRPGATEYDQQGRVQGALDIPLSEDGLRQVEDSVEQLRGQSVEALYCGPGQSARQTANALGAALHLKPKTLERMANVNLGLWQGMLVEEVKMKQPKVYRQWQEQPETVCPPQGETISSAKHRVVAAIQRLARKHKSGVVAVVVAEPLAAIIRNFLREDVLNNLWRTTQDSNLWELIPVPPAVAVE
jgi:broad specificity phosphatase PhoE